MITHKDTLEAFIPAIENIDDNCSSCIRDFLDSANEALYQLESKYRYIMTDEYPVTVKVEKVE